MWLGFRALAFASALYKVTQEKLMIGSDTEKIYDKQIISDINFAYLTFFSTDVHSFS